MTPRKPLDPDPYLVLFACVFTGGKTPQKAIVRVDATTKHGANKPVRALADHPMVAGVKVLKTKCIKDDRELMRMGADEQTIEDFRTKIDEAYAKVRARLIEEGSLAPEDAPEVGDLGPYSPMKQALGG